LSQADDERARALCAYCNLHVTDQFQVAECVVQLLHGVTQPDSVPPYCQHTVPHVFPFEVVLMQTDACVPSDGHVQPSEQ
jgi:hypothetical protein